MGWLQAAPGAECGQKPVARGEELQKEAEGRKRPNPESKVRAGKLQPVPTHRRTGLGALRGLATPLSPCPGRAIGPLWQNFPLPPHPIGAGRGGHRSPHTDHRRNTKALLAKVTVKGPQTNRDRRADCAFIRPHRN